MKIYELILPRRRNKFKIVVFLTTFQQSGFWLLLLEQLYQYVYFFDKTSSIATLIKL